jgi:hypothetical protein
MRIERAQLLFNMINIDVRSGPVSVQRLVVLDLPSPPFEDIVPLIGAGGPAAMTARGLSAPVVREALWRRVEVTCTMPTCGGFG